MIGVERLDDHRIRDLVDDLQRSLEGSSDVAIGYGEADVAEYSLRVVLVLGDFDGNGAGVVGKRRLNAAQVFAEPKLDERVIVQAANGNSAPLRFFYHGCRRRPQTHCLIERQ